MPELPEPEAVSTARRKLDHVRINLEEAVGSQLTSGLERFRFRHRALPELDLNEVSTAGHFLGVAFAAPLLISSMTGGAAGLGQVNLRLAEAAQAHGIAMGVGSQRAALESGPRMSGVPESGSQMSGLRESGPRLSGPRKSGSQMSGPRELDPRASDPRASDLLGADALAASFRIRSVAPDILLLANLGAVQLNYGFGVDAFRRAVAMIEADALILHLKPLQEALQPEGNTRWGGLLGHMEKLVAELARDGIPVVAKEVGWGIGPEDARRLGDIGVAAIDVAGAGGTSWSEVEKHRAPSQAGRRIAGAFAGWGIPTADSLRMVRLAVPGLPVIASGGLRDGLDVAKVLALGASMAGLAGPFLRAAAESTEAVAEAIEVLVQTLRIAMFAVGARDLAALCDSPALVELAAGGQDPGVL